MPQMQIDQNVTTETPPAASNVIRSVTVIYKYGNDFVDMDVTLTGHPERRIRRSIGAQAQSTLETFCENTVKAIFPSVTTTTKIPDPTP